MRFLHKPSHAHFWLIKRSSLLSQKCLFEGLSKSLVTSLCLSKKHGLIHRVFQKFVPIINCILRKAFNVSLGKCKLIQVRNLSK